jgi:DNA-binding transcriptional MerR regulator
MSTEIRKDYSVSEVAELLGVSMCSLRVWEKAKCFKAPKRSLTHHRKYSQEDVERIRSFLTNR